MGITVVISEAPGLSAQCEMEINISSGLRLGLNGIVESLRTDVGRPWEVCVHARMVVGRSVVKDIIVCRWR